MTDTATRLAPPSPLAERRGATFEPTSYNPADNSIEVVWTTGAAVMRSDWFGGEYFNEILSTNPAAVRLGRLNAGAPFLDAHQDGRCGAVIGSVVPGSAHMAGGKGVARVRLADTADVADTVAKIKAGHIRNVSVGYKVFTFERVERAGDYPTMTAIDWEPTEISAVPVPADAGCQIRSEPTMTDTTTDTTTERTDARTRTVTMARISEACRGLTPADTNELMVRHETTPMTSDELLSEVTTRYAARHDVPSLDNSLTAPAGTRGSPDALRQRMAGAVRARLSDTAPAAESREFMGATMIDMVRGLLIARGERAQYMSPAAVFERSASMTTSDFPLLLAAPVGSYLNELFAAAPPQLQVLARARTVRDFKPITGLTLEGDGSLPFIAENGEYTYGAFSESGQQYKVNTFGKIFALSRQAIINDNLGAYAQMTTQYVRRAAGKRADILAAIINTNVPITNITTKVSTPLFDASRGNLAVVNPDVPSTGELNVENLTAARLAMRTQRDASKNILDVVPRYLVVGPEMETKAEQVLAVINAASPSEVNPFSGKLVLIVESRLIGRAWYLFADKSAHTVLEYATLEGQEDVFTDTRLNWNPDQIETKVRIDYGAAAIDGIGAYKNPGVPA